MAEAKYRPVPDFSDQIPGFIDSFLKFLGSSSDYLSSRLQLLGVESKEAAGNVVRALVLLVLGLLLLLFTYVFLVIGLVFLLQRLTHADWLWVTLGVGLLHFVSAVLCLWAVKGRLLTSHFSGTIAEFQKDKEWLTTSRTTTPPIGSVN